MIGSMKTVKEETAHADGRGTSGVGLYTTEFGLQQLDEAYEDTDGKQHVGYGRDVSNYVLQCFCAQQR